MPCIYDNDDSAIRSAQAKLDQETRYLCEAMRLVEEAGLLGRCGDLLQERWRLHKAADLKRRREEDERAERDRVKAEALAKLTIRERSLLGL